MLEQQRDASFSFLGWKPVLTVPASVQELAVSERQKRQAQQERDELADEMVNSSSGKYVSLT